ncbi:MAG: cyclic nucleotide-binding domain-containing protein [Chloroflexota bacterium]
MDGYETLLAEQRFLRGMEKEHLEAMANCAAYVRFKKGEFLFHEGESARRFYIISSGQVALETFASGRGELIIGTLEDGDVLGWSWLFEPYRWHFDALAQTDITAVAFDALCLRGKCDADHDLGYELVKRFSRLIMERLQATRLALIDVYGAQQDTAAPLAGVKG